jgi:hypothetical protein
MSDFLVFDEGASELVNNGLPSSCYFLLSTKSVGATSPHTVGETLAGATLGEITGTGYARLTEAEPTASVGVVSFAPKSWSTGSATDWPAAVRSVVIVTGASTSGKAIAAFNLQAGGTARDLSAANVTENATITLTLPPG